MATVDALIDAAAGVPFTMAVLVIAVAFVRAVPAGRAAPAELAAGLGLGLEFLLAAGLLRLSTLDDFAALAIVAVIVLLRRVIATGLRLGLRALGEQTTRRIRA